jgi:general secretion pathway protein I
MSDRWTHRAARAAAGGFTLLEVLVALAVVALALGAIVQTTTHQTQQAEQLQTRTLAHWVGSNALNRFQLESTWPSTGTRDGEVEMAGRVWHWELTIEETADANVRRLRMRVLTEPEAEVPVTEVSGFAINPDADDGT